MRFFILALVLAGCSSSLSDGSFQNLQQNLRIAIAHDPESLDPREASDIISLTLSRMLFDGLTRLNAEGQPELAVAASVTISEDRRQYTFVLKDTVWSNGDPVTAQDFVRTWTSLLNPASKYDYAYLLYAIKNALPVRLGMLDSAHLGVRALDVHTLQVELEHPTPYFLELTAFPAYSPVHADHKIDSPLICNGPFQVKSWKLQDSILVEKNPLYWDVQRVHLNYIHMAVIGDPTTELSLFDKGELDWAGAPLSSLPVEALPKLLPTMSIYPRTDIVWLKFNTQQCPFNHPKIRQALSYAIQRAQIAQFVVPGDYSPATTPLSDILTLQPTPCFRDGDQITAKKLFLEGLQESGSSQEAFSTVSLSYCQSEKMHKIVQAIQQQWRKAFDIEIQLETLEAKMFAQRIARHNFDLAINTALTDFMDPMALLEMFEYRRQPTKEKQWMHPGYLFLLNEASEAVDYQQRMKILCEAEKLLIEQMPIAPLFYQRATCLKKTYVQGVVVPPAGPPDFKSSHISH